MDRPSPKRYTIVGPKLAAERSDRRFIRRSSRSRNSSVGNLSGHVEGFSQSRSQRPSYLRKMSVHARNLPKCKPSQQHSAAEISDMVTKEDIQEIQITIPLVHRLSDGSITEPLKDLAEWTRAQVQVHHCSMLNETIVNKNLWIRVQIFDALHNVIAKCVASFHDTPSEDGCERTHVPKSPTSSPRDGQKTVSIPWHCAEKLLCRNGSSDMFGYRMIPPDRTVEATCAGADLVAFLYGQLNNNTSEFVYQDEKVVLDGVFDDSSSEWVHGPRGHAGLYDIDGEREVVHGCGPYGLHNAFCLKRSRGGYKNYSGIHRVLEHPVCPTSVEFWVRSGKPGAGGSAALTLGTGTEPNDTVFHFLMTSEKNFAVMDGFGTHAAGSFQIGCWYKIKIKMDWAVQRFNLWIDGQERLIDVNFYTRACPHVSHIYFYNPDEGVRSCLSDLKFILSPAESKDNVTLLREKRLADKSQSDTLFFVDQSKERNRRRPARNRHRGDVAAKPKTLSQEWKRHNVHVPWRRSDAKKAGWQPKKELPQGIGVPGTVLGWDVDAKFGASFGVSLQPGHRRLVARSQAHTLNGGFDLRRSRQRQSQNGDKPFAEEASLPAPFAEEASLRQLKQKPAPRPHTVAGANPNRGKNTRRTTIHASGFYSFPQKRPETVSFIG